MKNLHIVIYLSFDCNLRCSYCVINFTKNVINEETIKNTIIFIEKIKSEYNNIFVEFIGGEPLLYYKKIINILDKLSYIDNIKFQITTNGTLFSKENYSDLITRIDKVNLSYNENYFFNNSLFLSKINFLIDKNNFNINFIYDPRRDYKLNVYNFLLIIKQGFKMISILPIVLVYEYTKKDFELLIMFLRFVSRYKDNLNIEFIYYIQEKNNHLEITINPNGDILGDNMGTAEDFFNVTRSLNKVLGNVSSRINLIKLKKEIYNHSYNDYIKNLSINGKTKQSLNNLLFLSNLLKKYNDKISFRNRID